MVVHLPESYLTPLGAFSLSLNTMAFAHSTIRWFESSACTANSAGLPPSFIQHSDNLSISSTLRGAQPSPRFHSMRFPPPHSRGQASRNTVGADTTVFYQDYQSNNVERFESANSCIIPITIRLDD
jgi:hypothetical protein